MSRLSYKTLFIILFFLLIPIVFLLKINQKSTKTLAAWWNDSWMYRQSINISSHTSAESNVYITATINIGDTSKAQTDDGDFRFTSATGDLYSYYIVSGAGTTAITFHIQLDTFPSGAQTIFAYYSNPSATNGFSPSDFSTAASNYTIGSLGTEETGGAPIAWWKFDEGVGTTTYDSSSNKNNGVLSAGSSTPTWISEDQCISNKCLFFNGNTGTRVTSTSKIISIGDFTVETWFKTNNNQTKVLIGNRGGGVVSSGFTIYPSGNYMVATYGNGTSSATNITAAYNYYDGKWHHLVYRVQRTSTQLNSLYLDNKLISSNTGTIGGNVGTVGLVGIGDYASGGFPFQGFIDDIKIYNYARSIEQIAQDYTTGKSGQFSSKGTNTSFSSSSSKSLSDGLVGYWKFDEGVGTSSADSSGNNNLTTFAAGDSSPSWSGGKFGIGISFNGVTSYLQTGTTLSSTAGSPRTISAWVKNFGTTGRKEIINTFNNYFNIQSNKVCIYITGANSTYFCSNSTLSPTQWTNVLFTYDGSSEKIYINGNLDNSTSSTTSTAASGGITTIGICSYCGMINPTDGLLDEVRIYNRALSPDEVKQLYNYAPGPIGYFNFDEGTGTSTYDKSGNNIVGTLQNGTTWDIGKYGKAIALNIGTSGTQYVSLNSNIKHPYTFTKEAWIKPVSSACGSENRCDIISPYFEFTSSNRIEFYSYQLSPNGWFTGGTISLNQWQHVAVSYDGINLRLYVNGIQVSSTAASMISLIADTNDIGRFNTGRYFRGYIDDIKIYNYARTQEQILQDMQGDTTSTKLAGPIAWYKFDEGQGTVANNSGSIGSTLNATLGPGTSTPTWTSGKNNKALSFNGNSNYVYLSSDNDLLDIRTGSYTATAWIKAQVPTGSHDIIVQKGASSLGVAGYWWGIRTDGKMDIAISDGLNWLSNFSSGNTVVADNNWHYLTFVWNPNSGIILYIDGKTDINIGITSTADINSSQPFKIGGYPSAGYSLNGLIDDVKIYNYALSADEIKTDYNQSSSAVFGVTNLTVGNTSNSTLYCVPGSTDPCSPPIAEWKFDEGLGTTAYDTSGNNKNGIFGPGTSTPTWTTGKIGNGLSFTGNNYVDLSNNFGITGNITVNVWIKTNSSSNTRAVIAKYGNNGAYTWKMSMNSSGKILFNRALSGTGSFSTTVTSNKSVNDNQWHFITIHYNSSYMSIYIDGQLDNQTAENRASDSLQSWETCIGDDSYTCGVVYGDSPWIGLIDQVRIYNYARTPAQIAWDYNRGGPVAWWKFDECQGSIVHDSSGIGNTGAISIGASGSQNTLGTCQTGTSAAWTNGANGKINSSLSFDGTDDWISLGNSSSLNTPSDYSIAMWIYNKDGSKNYPTFLSRNGQSGTNGYFWIYTTGTNDRDLNFHYANGSTYVNETFSNAIPLNSWAHVLFTFNSNTKELQLFINGVKFSNSRTLTNSLPVIGGSLYIGTYQGLSASYPFYGQIDDVRIYNYALTTDQIKQIYNGGAVNFR